MAHQRLVATSSLILIVFLSTACADGLPVFDSFESGTNTPEGWRQGASIPGVRYVYDKGSASAGKRSLSLQKSANRYFPIAQWVRELNHDGTSIQIKMSAKVKAAQATKAIMEVQFYDGTLAMTGKEWVAYIGQKEARDRPASHSWKDYSGQADVPAGTTKIVIALQIYGPGKVWFDELTVNETGATKDAVETMSVDSGKITGAPSSVPAPKVQTLQLESGAWTRFVMMRPEKSKAIATAGYQILFVLPGGDGSIEFQPFVQRLAEQALDQRYLVIQLVAPPHIVWPTESSQSRFATTEESIQGILSKLAEKVSIDRSHVYALAWSSSGPAIYSSLLEQDSPLTGAYIAMSVFKPQNYPPLRNAKGKRVFLLHSPEDTTCPYSMAQQAQQDLTEAGATVQLTDYAGGHGWRGDVMSNVRAGMNWLSTTQSRNWR